VFDCKKKEIIPARKKIKSPIKLNETNFSPND
jgi:hypothetical protein